MRLVEPPEPVGRPVDRMPHWQRVLLWGVLIVLTLPWWIGLYVITVWAL